MNLSMILLGIIFQGVCLPPEISVYFSLVRAFYDRCFDYYSLLDFHLWITIHSSSQEVPCSSGQIILRMGSLLRTVNAHQQIPQCVGSQSDHLILIISGAFHLSGNK